MSTFTNDLIVQHYLAADQMQQNMEQIYILDPIISDSIKLPDQQAFILPNKPFTVGKVGPDKKHKKNRNKV